MSRGDNLTNSTAAWKQMFVCPVWGRWQVTLPDYNINWMWNCVNGKRRKACCYRLSNISHLQVFTQVVVSRTFTDLSFFYGILLISNWSWQNTFQWLQVVTVRQIFPHFNGKYLPDKEYSWLDVEGKLPIDQNRLQWNLVEVRGDKATKNMTCCVLQ